MEPQERASLPFPQSIRIVVDSVSIPSRRIGNLWCGKINSNGVQRVPHWDFGNSRTSEQLLFFTVIMSVIALLWPIGDMNQGENRLFFLT